MYKYGVVVGKFYPLHRGHVDLIQTASGKCEKLIVLVSHSDRRDMELYKNSNMFRYLSGKDKLKVVQKTFQMQKEIIPILIDETDCPDYPNGWNEWSLLVSDTIAKDRRIPNDFSWKDTVFYTSEPTDVYNYFNNFGCLDVRIFDTDRKASDISGTKIRQDIIKYWDYLPRASKEILCPTIVIAGGESSGKTTLVDKLGNYFSTTTVWEYGRTYTDSELGGDEGALQYDDYQAICNGHYRDVRFAKRNANKFVISDTDYIATQAFCITYEGREHPSVEDKIINDKFDLVILLDNNTKWVDDGMRLNGKQSQRRTFQNLLKSLYRRYNIPYIEVSNNDYDMRYKICIDIINMYLYEHSSIEELQKHADRLKGFKNNILEESK